MIVDGLCRQIRQGINNSTKGTVYVVYDDVVDAKQACDKLNGFNFQGRYLVGTLVRSFFGLVRTGLPVSILSVILTSSSVLYHQPEKTVKSRDDFAERQQNLEKTKRDHGID